MSGKFSPTEAAAVATAYALVIGLFVYHELDLKGIWEAFVNAAKSTGQILIIVALASLFSWVITVAQIPQTVSAMLQDNIHSKVAMLMVINIILLIAGTFIDTTSAIVIFAPLFIHICKAMNVDLRHDYDGQSDHWYVYASSGRLPIRVQLDCQDFAQGSDAGSTAHAGSADRRSAFGHLYSRPYPLASESL